MDDNLFQLCFTKQTNECEIFRVRRLMTAADWLTRQKKKKSLLIKVEKSSIGNESKSGCATTTSNPLSPVLSITVAEIEALMCAADIQFFSLVVFFATSQKNIMFPSRFEWCTGHYTSQRVNRKKRDENMHESLNLRECVFLFLLWRIY